MPTMADRYELLQRASAHRALAVHEARDTRLDRPVVVTTASDGGDPRRARELARRHDGHPNLVPVLDAGVDGGHTFWVTEPLPRSLADLAPLDAEGTRILLHAVLAGLDALHERGLALGRLAPEQVRVHDDGTVRLAALPDGDGRLVPLAGAPATAPPPAFTAPEVRAGAPATRAGDARVIGALASYARTGRSPVAADGDATTAVPAGPEDVLALVEASSAAQPEDRPGDAAGLARLLYPVTRPTLSLPTHPPAEPPEPRGRGPRGRRRGGSPGRVAVSAGVGATLVLLTLVAVLGGPGPDATADPGLGSAMQALDPLRGTTPEP